jgi:hypothetical protein
MSLITTKRLAVVTVAMVLLAYPLIYLGNYAGDAQVHLIYGENAAHGRFFEFNQGEPSAGVTSPGFMLLLAGLFKVAPDSIVPALMKATNLLAWYGLVLIFFLLARRILRSGTWALFAALAVGLMPGSVYNSTIGMENGIFGMLVIAWVYYAVRTGWFEPHGSGTGDLLRDLGAGGLLGVACWVRPEGYLVAGAAVSFRAVIWLRSDTRIYELIRHSMATLVPLLALAGGLAYFHYVQTGYLLPTSGSSRILMSNVASDTFHLGPLFASPKFTFRLAAYFPMALLWLAANWLFFTRKDFFGQWRTAVGFSLLVFWAFFVLYSTVLGSTHLSRYIIFIMPIMALVATAGGKWLWEWNQTQQWNKMRFVRAAGLIAAPLVLLAVYGAETNLRLGLDSQSALSRSINAVSEREEFTDELLNRLGVDGSQTVSVALQEVQLRYWLNDRIIVRSLDGRVDPLLLDHATDTGVDHLAYLDERKVDFILQLPNYNRDASAWSLARFTDLKPGESVRINRMEFTNILVEDTPSETGRGVGSSGCQGGPPSGQAPYLSWFLSVIICIDHTS